MWTCYICNIFTDSNYNSQTVRSVSTDKFEKQVQYWNTVPITPFLFSLYCLLSFLNPKMRSSPRFWDVYIFHIVRCCEGCQGDRMLRHFRLFHVHVVVHILPALLPVQYHDIFNVYTCTKNPTLCHWHKRATEDIFYNRVNAQIYTRNIVRVWKATPARRYWKYTAQ